MDTQRQESRVIPLATKVTAEEKRMVDEVARSEGTTPAALIRTLVLPHVEREYRRLDPENAGRAA